MPPALLLAAKSVTHDMFDLGAPVLEKILRPVIVYVCLVVLLRIFGKRELAQLNPFDLVVLLTLSNTVQNAIIGADNSVTGGIIGVLSLFLINYAVVRFLFRHRRLDEMLQGTPTTLIENGRVKEDALAKELLTFPELTAVLHRQGFEDVSEVESCVIEPGGTFHIDRKNPPIEDLRHSELMERLDQVSKKIDELRALTSAT